MILTELRANRRFLADSARAAHAPTGALTALTLINTLAVGAFVFCLTRTLSRGPAASLLAGLAVALVVRGLAVWGAGRLAARHAGRVKSALRRQALRAALGRRRDDGASLGETAAAVVDEIEAMDGYFSRFLPAAREARIAPLVIAVLVASASPLAAGLLLFTLVPFAAIMALAGGAAGAEADRQFDALARLSGQFVDRVRALPVILAFQAEARETGRIAAAAEQVSARTLKVLRVAFVSTAALEFFAALAVALTAVYAGFSLLGLLPFRPLESLDFPRAFLALALAPEFYGGPRRLAGAYHEKQLGEAAAGRLRGLLARRRDVDRQDLGFDIDGAPEVRAESAVLRCGDRLIGPIEATFPAGALTAVVGPTGSGKTSLLATILGLASLESGSVWVGGAQLDEGRDLAGLAAWADQTPAFFPASVLDNLMIASPEATRRGALEMAERVGLTLALKARAEGLDTALDERGSGLSGGERRRLALARALLKPAPLLLLDEPTADLDAQSATAAAALIRAAAGERTVIVATHDEALAAAADHVVRLA